MKQPLEPSKALDRLTRLCAASEQCTADIVRKLSAWMVADVDARAIIRFLHDNAFVDDDRFARAYTHDKVRFARWGRYKIIRGLMAKRLPRAVIDRAVATIDPEEYREVLLALLRAKAPTIAQGNTFEGRTRLFRFAASRGFETELIARMIKTEQIWPSES